MLGSYSQTSDYIAQLRTLLHDPNAADYTDAQLIPFVNNARLRVAQDLRCLRQFITGLNTITQQEAYPLNGFVGGVVVNNGGTGYATTTTGTISGGGGSAAAVQVLTASGVITGINMTNWGGGYTSTPTLTLANTGGGTGATFNVIAGLMIHDILTMTVLWNGPPSSLAVTFNWLPFGAFQAFCRAYRATFSNPGAYAVHYGTTSPTMQQADARAFYLYPIPNQAYPLEMDVSILPNNLVNTADVDYQIVSPWNDAVQYFGAHLAYLGLQQYTQAGVMENLYQGRCRQLPATGFVRRVHNFYRTYSALIRRM